MIKRHTSKLPDLQAELIPQEKQVEGETLERAHGVGAMLEHARMDNVTSFLLCIQQYGIGDQPLINLMTLNLKP
jgi:hypothetical protein